ncbi:substrate-binding periplasmic protein [Vibrio bivalvicida]|uniref:Solute-binding protein family 3/N-terminal domain-containing protein n=1 Tax=Vibrio bivalvicida TaxID=1276888 RepID=A0A177XVS2_9VIBR|nr:transporter substrate-binding domain-containing protein [Vibrio bivalvicida]OAJ92690.1 hypothetical protein APB76_18580 [Vibrio bivalvicida]
MGLIKSVYNPINPFLLVALALLPFSSFSNQVLTISVGSDYPPYHSKELPGYGINAQIVTAAFAEVDIDVEYEHLSTWEEALDSAAQGQFDATALWEYNPQHESSFLISDSVYEINAHLFHSKELNFSWDTVKDLQGYKISALIGGYYGQDFENAEKTKLINVERVHDETDNVIKLVSGAIDLAPLYTTHFNLIIKQEGLGSEKANITYHPQPLFVNSLHLLLPINNPNSPSLIEKFNQGLKIIRKNGTLQSLLNEHLKYL